MIWRAEQNPERERGAAVSDRRIGLAGPRRADAEQIEKTLLCHAGKARPYVAPWRSLSRPRRGGFVALTEE